MPICQRILIIGAGPVGLTAALELARRGISSRIIDNNAPSPINESRALAVNQRTMDLLAPSGVAKLIDAEAIKLRQMQVFSGEKQIMKIDLGMDAAEADISAFAAAGAHGAAAGRTAGGIWHCAGMGRGVHGICTGEEQEAGCEA